MRAEGARVVGTVNFTQPVTVLTDEEMTGEYDVIFLMTKQLHNAEVVNMLKGSLAEDGVIVTLQNGLPELLISEIVGPSRVLGCTVAWGATMLGPGVCELTSSPDSLTFSLGAVSENVNKHFAEVKALLEKMGPVEVEEKFPGRLEQAPDQRRVLRNERGPWAWTFGEAASDRSSRRVVEALIEECIDVCRKGGITIEPIQGKDVVKLLDYSNPVKKFISFMIIPIAIGKHARLKASMLQDLERGKKTEVDSINGAVSAYGRKVGCPTPMNDKVVEIIHRIESGSSPPPSTTSAPSRSRTTLLRCFPC